MRQAGAPHAATGVDAVLAIESLRFGRVSASRVPALQPTEGAGADLVIDLTGTAVGLAVPVLTVEFNGERSLSAGLSRMLTLRTLPELVTRLDGVPVGRARPMLSDRVWLSRWTTDILAAAVSLIEQTVGRFAAGKLEPIEASAGVPANLPRPAFLAGYLPFMLRGVGERLRHRRRLGKRPFYWQVGYRSIVGAGVAETAALTGPDFTVLPDDGERFYADPFVLERDGRHYLFVEEFPYASGRGVISVAEMDSAGRFGMPRVVVEEDYHLSYPQVFEHGGDVWLLPESSEAGELVLYRAEEFPDRWERATVLVDRALGDATLLARDGRFWLFATERLGQGSFSDTMSVFVADGLAGPYRPHPQNPILIDRAAARPGGAFVERDGRLFLPVQDGTEYYGGGLGLAELLELDEQVVRFAAPEPVAPGNGGRCIHTLNRAGAVEVVDWFPSGTNSPRWQAGPATETLRRRPGLA